MMNEDQIKTKTQMRDPIERQAAIDAIEEYFEGLPIVVHYDMLEMVKALPSVQPELPIKEKCCYCPHCANCDVNDDLTINQQEQRWIPCSERLPEDLEEVNVTWVNHNPEPYYNFAKDKPFTATAVYYKEKWYWYTSTCVDMLAEYGRNPNHEIDDDIEITAWMPLPEPYTADMRGEQE